MNCQLYHDIEIGQRVKVVNGQCTACNERSTHMAAYTGDVLREDGRLYHELTGPFVCPACGHSCNAVYKPCGLTEDVLYQPALIETEAPAQDHYDE